MMKQMKWLFAAALVFMFSCANDEVVPTQQEEEKMVDFTVSVSIPQDIKTYGSAHGGITNVMPSEYALRYIFEAWSEDGTTCAHRGYKIVTTSFTNIVTFEARLMAAKYKFVFWADFVDLSTTETNANTADKYYVTNTTDGLKNITIKGDYGISNEARDAYYAVEDADLSASNYLSSVTLKRPFGKYRVIAIDQMDGYKGTLPNTSQITYTASSGSQQGAVSLPAGFNALEKKVLSAVRVNVPSPFVSNVGHALTAGVGSGQVTIGGKTYIEYEVIGFDYIFADNAQTVAFDFECFKDGQKIGVKTEVPNIPIKANTLTTIVGDFFSNSGNISVIISDGFDDSVTDEHLLPGLGGLMSVQGGAYIKKVKLGTNDDHNFTWESSLPEWVTKDHDGGLSKFKFSVKANTTGLPRKATITASDNTTQEKYKLTIEQAEYIQLSSDGPKWAVSNVDLNDGRGYGFTEWPGFRGQYFLFSDNTGRYFSSPYIKTDKITDNVIGDWVPSKYPTPSGWQLPAKNDYQTLENLPSKWYQNGATDWVGNITSVSNLYPGGVWVGPDAESATPDNWGNAIFFPSSGVMVSEGGIGAIKDTYTTYLKNTILAPCFWTSAGVGTKESAYFILFKLPNAEGKIDKPICTIPEINKSGNASLPVRAVKQ